jgi:hypothetical protein
VNLVGSCRKNEGGARLRIELNGDVDAKRIDDTAFLASSTLEKETHASPEGRPS